MEVPRGCNEIERDLFVSPPQFEQQMADLANRGFQSVSLAQFHEASDRSVLITFDDAYSHIAETVTPILQRCGFTAVMFVPPAHLGGLNTWDAPEHPRLAALEIAPAGAIRSLAFGLWEIGSHGFRHVDLRQLDPETLLRDLCKARETLCEISGKTVSALAYPYGLVDDIVESSARAAGYSMGFVEGPGKSRNGLRLARHPVRGSESLSMFRARTSPWQRRLRPVQRIAPVWARRAVRMAINGRGD